MAYPALGQPSKLSLGNPGMKCFACEERRVASELEAAAKGKTVNRRREARHTLREGEEPNDSRDDNRVGNRRHTAA